MFVGPHLEKLRIGNGFKLFEDLGTITIPDSYRHDIQLDSFSHAHRAHFAGYNDHITDKNFPRTAWQLDPGDVLSVEAYLPEWSIVRGTTDERMRFLELKKGVLVGARGLTLVWEQLCDKLPRGYAYISFDALHCCQSLQTGICQAPYIIRQLNDTYDFYLADVPGHSWVDIAATLLFRDITPDENY